MHNDYKSMIVHSNITNPWYNLALEEYLLGNAKNDTVIFYIWQNKSTVVIGKNQNPWKECRLKELEEDKGRLARRITGGGAVYHDMGNLNFSFIMGKSVYNVEKQLGVIIDALRSLGISAEFSGRNDITVMGKKISGNAFYEDECSALHHGTLLVNTDISMITKYLQVSIEKIQSKGIDSIKSRVVNLSSINSSLNIESITLGLLKSFKRLYGGEHKEIDSKLFSNEFRDVYKKYSSWEWIYGETPDFDVSFSKRFEWGGLDMGIKFNGGIITASKLYSDAMDSLLIENISEGLKGAAFEIGSMCKILDKVNPGNEGTRIIQDIKAWLSELMLA